MKNSTSFKSVKVGDKVRFIEYENEVKVGEVYQVNDKTFYVQYVSHTHEDGSTSLGYKCFNKATGKKASYRNTHGDCLEIL